MEYRIRSATSDDQPIIRHFIRSARLNPLSTAWPGFIISEASPGEVIGCAQIKSHRDGSRELASLYVVPRFRGQGVARAMVENLQNAARGELWLTCRAGLASFYEPFGFVEVLDPARMPGYFRRVWRLFRLFVGRSGGLAVMHWSGVS